MLLILSHSLLHYNVNHQSNYNSIVLLGSDFASIFITPPSLIDSAPQTQLCS